MTLMEALQIVAVLIALAGLLLEYKKFRLSRAVKKKPPRKPRKGN